MEFAITYTNSTFCKMYGHILNAKLTETQIEELESSLIELKIPLVQLESSLIQ